MNKQNSFDKYLTVVTKILKVHYYYYLLLMSIY